MTIKSEDKILHQLKNVAQILMCLEKSVNNLTELVYDEFGIVDNTDCDAVGNDRWTGDVGEDSSPVWCPHGLPISCNKKEEI